MSYGDHVAEHLRLSLLRALADGDGAYSANDSILADVIERVGIPATRDQVRTHILWLRDQGLMAVEEVHDLLVARLTGEGLDVARGKRRVPGVKRPSP